MSFASIKLTSESKRIIEKLAKSGNIDLRPSMKVVGIGYRKEVKAIFSKQQPRAEGMKWPQLNEKYAEWKERNYPGQPLLVRTGALKSSMTEQGASGNITVISKIGAVFGSSVSYGIYHDKGGSKIPKRNFSEVSERRKQIWINQIGKNIVHNFEQNGIQVEGAIFQ